MSVVNQIQEKSFTLCEKLVWPASPINTLTWELRSHFQLKFLSSAKLLPSWYLVLTRVYSTQNPWTVWTKFVIPNYIVVYLGIRSEFLIFPPNPCCYYLRLILRLLPGNLYLLIACLISESIPRDWLLKLSGLLPRIPLMLEPSHDLHWLMPNNFWADDKSLPPAEWQCRSEKQSGIFALEIIETCLDTLFITGICIPLLQPFELLPLPVIEF
jgi:hypothetical protein